jgi:hypothetical protein
MSFIAVWFVAVWFVAVWFVAVWFIAVAGGRLGSISWLDDVPHLFLFAHDDDVL